MCKSILAVQKQPIIKVQHQRNCKPAELYRMFIILDNKLRLLYIGLLQEALV